MKATWLLPCECAATLQSTVVRVSVCMTLLDIIAKVYVHFHFRTNDERSLLPYYMYYY